MDASDFLRTLCAALVRANALVIATRHELVMSEAAASPLPNVPDGMPANDVLREPRLYAATELVVELQAYARRGGGGWELATASAHPGFFRRLLDRLCGRRSLPLRAEINVDISGADVSCRGRLSAGDQAIAVWPLAADGAA